MNRFSRNRHRRDATQAGIVETLVRLGCSVSDSSQCDDPGRPDVDVGLLGQDFKIECKSRGKALTEVQRLWHANWRGAAPVTLWTPDQAEAWVSIIRRRLICGVAP